MVLLGDLLRPEVLLDGHRVVGAALDRRVVRHDHDLPTRDAPDAGDYSGSRHLAVVHPEGRQGRELQERRVRVEYEVYAVPHRQLAALLVPLPGLLAATAPGLLGPVAQLLQELLVGLDVTLELVALPLHEGPKLAHRFAPSLASRSRRTFRRTLPVAVVGSSSTNSTSRGYSCAPRRFLTRV